MPALTWALANWKLLLGGVMLATIAALLFVIGQKNDAIEAGRNALAACNARHAITRQSLATAERAIADQNKAIRALEAEGAARSKAAEDALRAAREANKEARGAIDRLKRSAAEKPSPGDCGISDTLQDTKGL